ncbi:hypothetical protein NDU88_002265 [Pleurodeles waltl]|uniref:Uncharacterized protein n=1 Tax=Pleurodeles waltl TaxID=8319 RepID=A0AAV7UX45_PLEWA|nr:hypothetical protein NDU88_002265 [Pleurodeles waltl]
MAQDPEELQRQWKAAGLFGKGALGKHMGVLGGDPQQEQDRRRAQVQEVKPQDLEGCSEAREVADLKWSDDEGDLAQFWDRRRRPQEVYASKRSAKLHHLESGLMPEPSPPAQVESWGERDSEEEGATPDIPFFLQMLGKSGQMDSGEHSAAYRLRG